MEKDQPMTLTGQAERIRKLLIDSFQSFEGEIKPKIQSSSFLNLSKEEQETLVQDLERRLKDLMTWVRAKGRGSK